MSKPVKLPSGYQLPGWVEFFSYGLLLLLVPPLCLLAFSLWGQELWMKAFGFKVSARQHFVLYAFLVLLPFLGGLAGVGILRRRPWGLVLGLAFSAAAIVACAGSLVVGQSCGVKDHPAWLELALLLVFARWLLRTMTSSNPPLVAKSASTSGRWPFAPSKPRRKCAAP